MKYLSLFDDFTKVDESYNFDSDGLLEAKINQMSSLKENCMAAWDFSEFKDFFGGSLNEYNSEENHLLLEQAYYTYELGVLYEHNQDWFGTKGEIFFLESQNIAEGHVVLFKNDRIHIIKESTLERLKDNSELILEGFWDFVSSVGNFVKKSVKAVGNAVKKYVVEPVKAAATYVGKKVAQAWDILSSGAKAVWDFAKSIVSAIVTFIKENPLTAFALLLQIVSSIVAFIPTFGTVIAGVLTTVAGAITIYEASQNISAATKDMGAADKVKNIIKGGAKLVIGVIGLILGVKDCVTGFADAIPGAGMMSISLKSGVLTWATKFNKAAFGATVAGTGVGKMLGCSEWLGEFFGTLCGKAPFIEKGSAIAKIGGTIASKGADAALDKGKEAILDHEEYHEEWDETINEGEGGSWGFGELLINFLVYVGKTCFGWLYDTVVAGIGLIGKVINGLMELPGKITKGIDNFKKNYSGSFVGGIISGALSNAVKPMTSCAQRFIDQYIKPKVKPVTGWMTSLGKRNVEISKKIAGNPKLKSPAEGIKKKSGVIIAPIKVDISAKDKAAIKKIGVTGTATLVKAGGGSQKILDKMKKTQDEFKKKFPAVSKLKGTWGQSPTGKATYTYQSKEAAGTVTLFNDGKYTVITGPNKKARGEFQADKTVKLNAPKEGWKKNESGFNYLTSFDAFLAS
jgi:hypothetical protein